MSQALARENEQGPEPFQAVQARPKQTGGKLTATLQKSIATRLMNTLRHRIIDNSVGSRFGQTYQLLKEVKQLL